MHTDSKTSNTDAIFILCILSGIMFLLLYGYWCCAIFMLRGIDMHSITDCCSKSELNNRMTYGSLTCAFWIISILFISIATALLTDTLGGSLDLFLCEDSSNFDLHCLEAVVMIFMWTLIGLFACCNVFCYFICIRHLAGQICGRDEPRQNQ